MSPRLRGIAVLGAVTVLLVGCSGASSPAAPTPGQSQASSVAPTQAATATATSTESSTTLLGRVLAAGKIVGWTDPNYPPNSKLKEDGTYEGFDIDVANEIARRLGVDIEYATASWDTLTAGNWGARWDFAVGSMADTTQREEVIAFSTPYYYPKEQFAASKASGITGWDGLAGKTICVGVATIDESWLNGTLDFGANTPTTKPPAGVTVAGVDSTSLCAEAWTSGRDDWQGWLTSDSTLDQALADGVPLVKIDPPAFSSPLCVAFDKGGPDPTSMLAKVNEILEEMRSEGLMKAYSEKWFGRDVSTPAS